MIRRIAFAVVLVAASVALAFPAHAAPPCPIITNYPCSIYHVCVDYGIAPNTHRLCVNT